MSIDAQKIDLEKLSEGHHRNRVGNCANDRESWPCQRWLDAETINGLIADLLAARAEIRRLTAQRDAAAGVNHGFRERAEAAEESRDQALMKLSTASAEASAFRHQRDEVVEALGNLYVAVVKLTAADPTHYEVANAVRLPALKAQQLVERYRPKGATP